MANFLVLLSVALSIGAVGLTISCMQEQPRLQMSFSELFTSQVVLPSELWSAPTPHSLSTLTSHTKSSHKQAAGDSSETNLHTSETHRVLMSNSCSRDRPATVLFYTGDVQIFNIPLDVQSIEITAVGGSGASMFADPKAPHGRGRGGKGAVATASASTSRNENWWRKFSKIYVMVGGQGQWCPYSTDDDGLHTDTRVSTGGFNGGGTGGGSCFHSNSGGGGGGATDVRLLLDEEGSRVLVAAGGGGAGGDTGSDGQSATELPQQEPRTDGGSDSDTNSNSFGSGGPGENESCGGGGGGGW